MMRELPAALHKPAVDIFKVLLNYILAPAGAKEPWADIQEVSARTPAATGCLCSAIVIVILQVLKRGILRPELRDEIFNQVMRQTDDAPAEVSSRAWEWMAWCVGTFVPSLTLQPYLAVYLFSNAHRPDRPQVRVWAAYCLRRLERAVMISNIKGNRSLYRVIQPSVHELQLVKQMRNVTVQVTTPDAHKHDIEVDSAATVNESMLFISHAHPCG